MRYDIERLEVEHLTPRQFGVRIRTASHASHHFRREDATRKNGRRRPMRVDDCRPSFSTIRIRHGSRIISRPRAAYSLRQRQHPCGMSDPGSPFWRESIPKTSVSFLSMYNFHENSRDLDSKLISRYILDRREEGELLRFNIAVMGRSH